MFNRNRIACAFGAATLALVSFGLGAADRLVQPFVAARGKQIIAVDGYQFKDLNGNGRLDPYEDWRLPVANRIDDLLARMTVDEKAGMMLIDSVNASTRRSVSPLNRPPQVF